MGRARPAAITWRNASMPLSEDIRRVVTTVDQDGKAVVLFDGANPHKVVRPNRSVTSRLVWVTDQTPADISGTTDRAATNIGIAPPHNGSVFRIIDIPPTPPEIETLEQDYLHKQIGDHAPRKGLPPRHPLMHRTLTIDYAIIMQGEIDMLLDDSEVHLKAGDVLVQQGTNHAWVNRGTEPCRIAFILIESKEP
jgi:mannose-6-phosphate isomerase-like protein (cupin superfamily)